MAPSDEYGPDGRHWIELRLAPGERALERIAVRNLSGRDAVFELQAADGFFTPEGRFDMLARPEDSTAAGTWIRLDAEVEVPAGETRIVPLEIVAPPDAEPGDHAAGVAAALVRTGAADRGSSNIGVVSRFGIRVMTRVTGELAPGLEIRDLEAAYDMTWNPLRPGRVAASFDLVNTGNARLVVTGRVAAAGELVAWPGEDAPRIELLPGDVRRVEVQIERVWPRFAVRTEVEAVTEVLALEGVAAPDLPAVTARRWVAAVPWPQLAVLAGLVLIGFAVLAGRRRAKRRLAALLAAARADERARLAGGDERRSLDPPVVRLDSQPGGADGGPAGAS
ncbi:MAG: hypothetical protein LBJ44_00550 [Propionibacteriaceae bacterium]|nr:hypothetical protein [Propionibacteriaceae bacterium]